MDPYGLMGSYESDAILWVLWGELWREEPLGHIWRHGTYEVLWDPMEPISSYGAL